MKSLLIIFLMFFSLNCLGQSTSGKEVAYSCHEDGGRCTGSAYCSACKNCSRCAHCSSGGSCGVCSSRTNYETKTTKTKRNANSSYKSSASKSTVIYYKEDQLLITIQDVNLRNGPGTEYEILRLISKGTPVFFKEKKGEWALVRMKSIDKTGYINLKYLR